MIIDGLTSPLPDNFIPRLTRLLPFITCELLPFWLHQNVRKTFSKQYESHARHFKICIAKIFWVYPSVVREFGGVNCRQIGPNAGTTPLWMCYAEGPTCRADCSLTPRAPLLEGRWRTLRLVLAVPVLNPQPKTPTRDSAGGRLSTPEAAAPYADTPCARLNKQNPGHT